MNNWQLESIGLERAEAQTWPGTYSIVGSESFFAQQTSNRASATWKKAEYISVRDYQSLDSLERLLQAWQSLYWLNQFLIVEVDGECRLYDGRGTKLIAGSDDKVQAFIRAQQAE